MVYNIKYERPFTIILCLNLSQVVIVERMSDIETAAEDLFIKQIFHATLICDIY